MNVLCVSSNMLLFTPPTPSESCVSYGHKLLLPKNAVTISGPKDVMWNKDYCSIVCYTMHECPVMWIAGVKEPIDIYGCCSIPKELIMNITREFKEN